MKTAAKVDSDAQEKVQINTDLVKNSRIWVFFCSLTHAKRFLLLYFEGRQEVVCLQAAPLLLQSVACVKRLQLQRLWRRFTRSLETNRGESARLLFF